MCICICIYTYIYTHIHIYIYIGITSLSLSIYIYMYVCMYVCVYIYIYTYTYIHVHLQCELHSMPVSVKNTTLLLSEPLPCNLAAETPILPLIWCSESFFSLVCSSPKKCLFHRHRYHRQGGDELAAAGR